MNNCRICGKECTGKTCSGACRAKLSRRTESVETFQAHAHDKERTVEAHAPTRTASLEDYQANPDDYATRNDPARLNWGPHMDNAELEASHLYVANRVPIPGDWDYEGVVEEAAA